MKRYRIGLMVGNKSVDYIQAIRMGVQNTLEESNHVLVAISDLIPFHTRKNAKEYFQVAFELANRLNLDTVLVPAGTISSYLRNDYEYLDSLLHILDPAKTLVLEREIEGYRCIGKDSDPGMHECMCHLIEACGFTKIAFLGGPISSTSAKRRKSIYLEEMKLHGLETPDSLIEYGEYSGECGDSIDKLLDNNPGLEAIACCCDLEAHAVYDVLRKRNLTVGKDIAVTGFDDHVMSAHLDPPLSTVHMTSYDLGCMAAREAIRICEGLPQKEFIQSSRFVARASCGENGNGQTGPYDILMARKPFPLQEVTAILVSSSLVMAPQRVIDDFTESMSELVSRFVSSYWQFKECPDCEDKTFSPQDLSALFDKEYQEHLSLEGFHSTAISLLNTYSTTAAPADKAWIMQQISSLHLSVARMLNMKVENNKAATGLREWNSFHMVDDALRESMNPRSAYKLILDEFNKLGVKQAHIYLLREPVAFIGSRTFALSDTLLPIGELVNGTSRVLEGSLPTSLQKVLTQIIPDDGPSAFYTVGGVLAGNELVGIAAIESGSLDDDGQLIAYLNLGIALKHLQMIAIERETNELLSKSNLLLERQSHYDEMTGALNRRGFMEKTRLMLEQHKGELAVLLYLDLDGLKTINDTFGHDIGDEAIRCTTRVLDTFLPSGSVVGRLGGDEFAVFTIVRSEKDMDALGRSIDAGMNTFNTTQSRPFELSISYGGVLIHVDNRSFAHITQSLAQADERLYKMKRKKGSKRI